MGTVRRANGLHGICSSSLLPQLRVPAPPGTRNTANPQECQEQKRQKVQQKIPSPEPGWCHLYWGCHLAAAQRTLHHQANTPQLLPVELSLSVVLQRTVRFHPRGLIKPLRQPAGDGLHPYRDLQVVRDGAARHWFHEYVECSSAHVRMSPESNYTRSNLPLLNDGKRRPIVCSGWRRQHQQEHNQKPNRNFSRTRKAIHHPVNTNATEHERHRGLA